MYKNSETKLWLFIYNILVEIADFAHRDKSHVNEGRIRINNHRKFDDL